jgi:hypothetical protein
VDADVQLDDVVLEDAQVARLGRVASDEMFTGKAGFPPRAAMSASMASATSNSLAPFFTFNAAAARTSVRIRPACRYFSKFSGVSIVI